MHTTGVINEMFTEIAALATQTEDQPGFRMMLRHNSCGNLNLARINRRNINVQCVHLIRKAVTQRLRNRVVVDLWTDCVQ